jgi:hypothetical protein
MERDREGGFRFVDDALAAHDIPRYQSMADIAAEKKISSIAPESIAKVQIFLLKSCGSPLNPYAACEMAYQVHARPGLCHFFFRNVTSLPPKPSPVDRCWY